MENLEFRILQRIIAGPNTLKEVGRLARELGGQRVLVVSDQNVIQAGHLEKVLHSLREANLVPFVFDKVEENPTTHHVEIGVDCARENGPIDSIIAVGGGSVMDCAKGINFLFTNGGSMEDYQGANKATCPMLTSIGVPTTAGTGSEAQSFAIIAQEETGLKMACGDNKALFQGVILDPVVTLSMPSNVTAITAMDAISHALESYVCTRRNLISQMFAKEAWNRLYANYRVVSEEPQDLKAREQMLWGAYFAGVAIENSMLGATHACANPLTERFGIVHGVAVGIMLPHVIRFNGVVANELYEDLLRIVGLSYQQGGAHCMGRLLEEMRQVGNLPDKLRDCHVQKSCLSHLAQQAMGQWTGKFNPRGLIEKDYLSLYKQAY